MINIKLEGYDDAIKVLNKFIEVFSRMESGNLVDNRDVENIKNIVKIFLAERLNEISTLPPKWSKSYKKWKEHAVSVGLEIPVESSGGKLPVTFLQTGKATGFMLDTLLKSLESDQFAAITDSESVHNGLMDFHFDVDVFYKKYPLKFNKFLKSKYGLELFGMDLENMGLVLDSVTNMVLSNLVIFLDMNAGE